MQAIKSLAEAAGEDEIYQFLRSVGGGVVGRACRICKRHPEYSGAGLEPAANCRFGRMHPSLCLSDNEGTQAMTNSERRYAAFVRSLPCFRLLFGVLDLPAGATDRDGKRPRLNSSAA